MATITLPGRTIAGAARRATTLASIFAAMRVRYVSLVDTEAAREHYLSQASDHADLGLRERAWKAYEDSLATISRIW
jgi:hypothetical protein